MGLGPDATLDAGLVSLFSDIGMSQVAEELIESPGRLSPTQWERVHRHCAASADLVEKIRGLRPIVAHSVYQHHERPDGSGYPRGRRGAFLHPLARIAAVGGRLHRRDGAPPAPRGPQARTTRCGRRWRA